MPTDTAAPPRTRARAAEGRDQDPPMHVFRESIDNILGCLQRLDKLSTEIAERQIDLARFSDSKSSAGGIGNTKPLRNKGSAESLKPKDDSEAHPGVNSPPCQQSPASRSGVVRPPPPISQIQPQQQATPPNPKARGALSKRQRPDSIASAEGAVPSHRSRGTVIVYYDSHIQKLFEDLVNAVSAYRNLRRKAKREAMFAQIKRMVEPDDDGDEEEDSRPGQTIGSALLASSNLVAGAPLEASNEKGNEGLSPLPYVNIRHINANMDGKPSDYDGLDKGLEYVQSMCENAAHQLLRHGSCNEYIEKIKQGLEEIAL